MFCTWGEVICGERRQEIERGNYDFFVRGREIPKGESTQKKEYMSCNVDTKKKDFTGKVLKRGKWETHLLIFKTTQISRFQRGAGGKQGVTSLVNLESGRVVGHSKKVEVRPKGAAHEGKRFFSLK